MSMSQEARALPKDRQDGPQEPDRSDPLRLRRLGPPVRKAIVRTRGWLQDQQHADGYWCAELEGDTILESETILLLTYLRQEDSELAQRASEYLVDHQLPDGGWAMYPGGKVEISTSVKAYFALKLTGHDPSLEYMQRAHRAILAHGGADAVNSFTRFYLALLGQISYDQCPEVPPEIVLLPKWFPANLYAVSSWSRTIIVPLSIVSAKRPVRRIDALHGIRELFLNDPEDWPRLRCPDLSGGTGWLSWDRFFRTADRLMRWCRHRRLLPLRRRAVAKAEQWMLDRFDGSDGLGAIYPPIVWSMLALKCLGYDENGPEMQQCREQLDALVIDDESSSTARVQPCKSPVWDTALGLRALSAAGLRGDNRAVGKAVDWLLDKQVTRSGDWAETVDVEPGGWCFEHANDFYPDSDDTAAVLAALHGRFAAAPDVSEVAETLPPEALPPELRVMGDPDEDEVDPAEEVARLERTSEAIRRGLDWMLAMQNDDGGWGAFDRNNNHLFLCYVPFADHNAMIDPSTPDLTGGVLESLGSLGRRVGDRAVDRAVAYLRRAQEPDGSWFGRWGVNYIYGTWKALTGLAAVGVPVDDPAVVAGVNWLLAHQQESGGWGESADSYDDPSLRGQGPVTASQTAWAVLGLLAAGYHEHRSVAAAVRFLLSTQHKDGTWDEPEFTGTGFPRVFYLRYHYYPIYFPLMALAEWAVKVAPVVAVDQPPALRVVAA